MMQQSLEPLAGTARNEDGLRKGIGQLGTGHSGQLIAFVTEQKTGYTVQFHLCQNGLYSLNLQQKVRMRGVSHMQQYVCRLQLLQRGAEGIHQFSGQITDKAHSVGQDNFLFSRKAQTSCSRIQCGEKLVLCQYV